MKTQKDDAKDILEQDSTKAPEGSETEAKPKEHAVSRRGLCIGIGGIAALGVLGGLRYVGHNPVVRPPGGTDESHLVDACIRCEKCYEACPRKVIMPTHIEDGLLGMRSPKMTFESNYCDFCAEEHDGFPHCVAVCPTGALRLNDAEYYPDYSASNDGCVLSDELADKPYKGERRKKTLIALGKASIDTNQCMAYRQTGCRKCYDNCPFGAIDLNSSNSAANPLPVVNTSKCNGCGACESVCISLTAGSIVEGVTERAITVKPIVEDDSGQLCYLENDGTKIPLEK